MENPAAPLVHDPERERKEIIHRYRRLLRVAKPILKEGDSRQVRKAFNLALEAHRNMRRKSGEPYIFHPLAVAEICVAEIGLGTTSIICALVHDVVEDTDIELRDLERMFGRKVARIVDGLTKIKGVFSEGTSAQAENFRKMLFTLSEDVRVILIKLADRLHNMRTLDSMPRHNQLKISSETIYLYAPLAHRLGLNAIKTELEDLYLKFTEAEAYQDIARHLEEGKTSRNKFIRQFVQPIKEELDKLGVRYEIRSRPKSVYSIFMKMRRQNIPFDMVYDLFAVRIILDTPIEQEKSFCWQVYSIVTDYYLPNPDRLRDWISTPKANGYESLHTTVMARNGQWVEVQIRTQRMDEIAEKGYAAHWKYKGNQAGYESNLEKWLVRVREILERQDLSALEFVDDFRGNLFNEEVFVFTPRGELKTLPVGATALDFAFEIHTDIGMRCIGAKVNQKLVPINHVLHNGDQIEILTSSKQRPAEDWLRFAVSSKARSRIKDALREDQRKVADEGRELLERKLRQLKIEPGSQVMEQLRSFLGEPSNTAIFFKFGKGVLNLNDLRRFAEQRSAGSIRPRQAAAEPAPEVPARPRNDDILLIGEDMDVVEYKLAKCCTPIPGDEVFGFVSVNEGIKIHRTNCPNGPELLANHGNRVIKARWTSQHEVAFLTGLKVVGTDRVGLINDVSRVISEELKVNMSSISFRSDGGIFEGEIMLYVNDTHQLDLLIGKLERVDGVVRVLRFDSRTQD